MLGVLVYQYTSEVAMPLSPIQFEIHPSSGVPIYRQLVEQVRALVASGQLAEGDLLPSVRQVARSAAVNPMTVSKAYALLESEGIVQRLRGQGMQVNRFSPGDSGTLRERKSEWRKVAQPAVLRARQLGLSDKQVRDLIDKLLRETR